MSDQIIHSCKSEVKPLRSPGQTHRHHWHWRLWGGHPAGVRKRFYERLRSASSSHHLHLWLDTDAPKRMWRRYLH